jgi:vacuolar-type H+-ATPase subunit F/Vma7
MSQPQLVVIASSGLTAGFALAGVRVVEAANSDEAAREIGRLADKGQTGVVIIEEPLYEGIPDEVRRGFARSALPVVIPVPGPDWTAESSAHEYIVEILRRAIGYRVRLQ